MRHTPIQRCQVHKARNIVERLPRFLQAGARKVLRQAWQLNDAAKAEKLLRNPARRLGHDALDEILTVSRLGLPAELRRLLERCLHAAALDRGCHGGGGKRLPAAESLQASRAALTAHQLKHTMKSKIED